MDTPRTRCKRCNAFVAAPTPVLVTEPAVARGWVDLAFGVASVAGLTDLAYRGMTLAYAALQARGYSL